MAPCRSSCPPWPPSHRSAAPPLGRPRRSVAHRPRLPRRRRRPPPPGGRARHRGPPRKSALRRRHPGLVDPGREVLDDDRTLDQWIREHLGTAQHTCGTVAMGPADDPEHAVVDRFGRVHGVRGLRVADTPILPDAPHRGPAATAVLIGEVVADAMRR
ncbi:GMC oxidoreductase [Streptomyces sp. NPDC050388]|uniref:GMC oxidoreductase n=1 Tax=Streptomyces sp. NPDC050388 TaxID=3155781 RepID=UPI003445CFC9